ncbi:MAG: FAD-dependent oxidoreductase [Pseudomonadota bacterium]
MMNQDQVFGKQAFPHIFQEGRIGKFRTNNRCKYAACSVSNYNTPGGFVSQRELYRDEVIAKTGAGVLTNQGVYPDRTGEGKTYPQQLAAFDDRFIPGLRQVADVWRKTAPEGTVFLGQILHGGRYGGGEAGQYWVPSAVVPRTVGWGKGGKPPQAVEMTKEDISRCIEDHANAAVRLVKAGFDGVEVTCFVGYLISNFLSKYTNRRTDEYGGSVENRARFMVELIQALRKAVGDHLIVGVRLSSDELLPEGNTPEENLEIMKIAQDEAGVDYISAVVAWHESPEGSWGREKKSDHFLYSLEGIKKAVHIPIAFGPQLKDPHVADKAIAEGLVDFWEMCRPFLADPELLNKARINDVKATKNCINCLWCGAKFGKGQPYICAINPLLGHEKDPDYQPNPILWTKKVMVVGGGPAGCEAALEAAKRGHQVTLFDRNERLGGQLLAASGDTFGGFAYRSLVEWYEEQMKRKGLDVRLNTEVTSEVVSKFFPDVIIMATGAKINVPNIPGATGGNVFSAYDILTGRTQIKGNRVAVLGATTVGFAVGHRLYDEGKEVVFVEKGPVEFKRDVVRNYAWRYRLWFKKALSDRVSSVVDAQVLEIKENGVQVRLPDGTEKFVSADSVVLVDKVQEQNLIDIVNENVDVLEIVGDAIRPRYIFNAVHEGFKAGRRI